MCCQQHPNWLKNEYGKSVGTLLTTIVRLWTALIHVTSKAHAKRIYSSAIPHSIADI